MSVEFHPQPSNIRPGHRDAHAHAGDQPFEYPLKREYVEPDWTRLPGYKDVTKERVGVRPVAARPHDQEPQGVQGGAR